MAPTLPSLAKSQSMGKLAASSSQRSSSRSNQARARRPEWCEPHKPGRTCSKDSVVSTRVPSEASSVAPSRASSVAPSRASSRPCSPSSSSAHDASPRCRLGHTASVPLLNLSALANQTSLPSLNQATAAAQLADFGRASCKQPGKPPAMKKMQPNVTMQDTEKSRSQLEQACLRNDIEMAKICFLRGAPLSEALPTSQEFPLHYAIRKQRFAFVDFLKQYGVDMNLRDALGRTALHIAAANNDEEAICRLVELGAKRKLQDHKGQTALHAAAAAGHTRVVELLLELSADINSPDKAGWTAVSHAEFNNHFDLAYRLIKLGGSDPRGMRNETRRSGRHQKS